MGKTKNYRLSEVEKSIHREAVANNIKWMGKMEKLPQLSGNSNETKRGWCKMNQWIGSGWLIKDAEIGYFPVSGNPYATFTIAIRDPYTRQGEPTVDFIDCIVHDKRGVELIEKYIRSGTKLEIVGWLKWNLKNRKRRGIEPEGRDNA